MRLLSDLKSDLNRRIRDKTNATIEAADETAIFNEAIRKLKSFHEFPGTKQRANMDTFLDILEYPVPSGYKSSIDFRSETQILDFEQRTSKEFWIDEPFRGDITFDGNSLSSLNIYADDNFNNSRILLMRAATNSSQTELSDMDTFNGNGTWVAVPASGATNVRTDSINFVQGSGSVAFDAVAATVPGIRNTTLTAVDLSTDQNISTIFVDFFLPTVTNLTSITLRYGSSLANFNTVTITNNFPQIGFRVGWNTLGFPTNGATVTGTPILTAITYLEINPTYLVAVTDTDFRVDFIRSIIPAPLIQSYYSKNFVQANDGTFKEEFTADDDRSVLEDWQDEMLMALAENRAFEILRDFEDAARALARFTELFQQITNDNVSEKDKPTDRYYYMS